MANVINVDVDGVAVQLPQSTVIEISQTLDTSATAEFSILYQENKTVLKSITPDYDAAQTINDLTDSLIDLVPVLTINSTTTDVEVDGTASAGAATTITLETGSSDVDDFYVGKFIYIVSGTGSGQVRRITNYVGSTLVATVNTWGTNPDNTSVYKIIASNSFFDASNAVAAANTDMTLAVGSSSVNDYYNGMFVKIVYGTGVGQFRRILDYVGSTRKITVDTWVTNPDTTSVYVIVQNASVINANRVVIMNVDTNTFEYNAEKNSNQTIVASYMDLGLTSQISAAVDGPDGTYVATTGNQSVGGVKTFTSDLVSSSTTDTTSGATGAIITAGGIGAEKAIYAGTTLTSGTALTVGTSLDVGTNVTLAKEVNHTVSVTTTTTAATAGGNLAISAAAGATTGAGGVASLAGGASGSGATGNGGLASVTGGAAASTNGTGGIGRVVGGAGTGSGAGGAVQATGGAAGLTGTGGAVTIVSGAGGGTSGASGAVSVSSGAATVGSSGAITVSSGNTASGVSGDVILTTGTHTSTTVSPVVSLNKAVIRKPLSSAKASGGTITGVELVGGLIAATGGTGNYTLPATADITTAIGSTPAGTYFEFVFNAAAMTATNTATLVVGANMSVQSSPAITGGGTLTVTQDTQVVGKFGVFFDTATTCKLIRLA